MLSSLVEFANFLLLYHLQNLASWKKVKYKAELLIKMYWCDQQKCKFARRLPEIAPQALWVGVNTVGALPAPRCGQQWALGSEGQCKAGRDPKAAVAPSCRDLLDGPADGANALSPGALSLLFPAKRWWHRKSELSDVLRQKAGTGSQGICQAVRYFPLQSPTCLLPTKERQIVERD